jgi:hypothetical protein
VAPLYKERKGEKKLSGCVRDQEYKAAPLSWNPLNKLEYMDANAATKKKLPLTGAQRNMRHTKRG